MRISYLLLFSIANCLATLEDPELTFEKLFKFGKDAYTEGRWTDCVGFMRRALEDWDYHQSETHSCAARCIKKLPAPSFDADAQPNYVVMSRFHHSSQRSLCINRCRRERFSSRRPAISKRDVVHDFLERRPFNYLQVCSWKDGEFAAAATAAYTYLVANPGDEEAKANMEFYMNDAEFTEDLLDDKMRTDYERMFISGVRAYEEEDWQKCVSHLDTALEEFFKTEELCRIDCRDRVDWTGIGSDNDVDTILTAIHRSTVSCQHDCLSRLSWINGHSFGNIVAQIYRYQHLCYFKQKRGQDAARAISNHLLLDASPDIRWNKAHYMTLYPGRDEIFRPEARIVEFARNRLYEQRFLDFVEDKSKLVHGMYPTESREDYAPLEATERDELIKDSFAYSEIGSSLSPELCKTLRQIALQLPIGHEKQARQEAETRVQKHFPYAKLQGLWCGELRRPACDRAVVLSIDADNCSEWLGPLHSGCALVACE
ncbi:hypothetical protein PFISCL1PPCAC_14304 [Pristionchus fissidentatus]|uniref:Leprecan-like alpha-helical domain-containing protein n=1 Tax=Pristionchus fissidentatus TaxID=1538716 RepID=A0AAV5VYJ6_9BILA|nr:hypothetical protein PFISCL1PPCAC_14304 [Pristionchus fissidentatus]